MPPNPPQTRNPPSSHQPMWPSPTTRHALIAPLNPHIDRLPAKVNHPLPSKLTISITQPSPHPPKLATYPNPLLDWSDQYQVSALNEWRTSRFRYWLGPKLRQQPRSPVVRYTLEEKRWIRMQGDREGRPRWAVLQGWFEEEFVRGRGRPGRSATQLLSQYRDLRKGDERRGGGPRDREDFAEGRRGGVVGYESDDGVSEMDDEEVGIAWAFIEKVRRDRKICGARV